MKIWRFIEFLFKEKNSDKKTEKDLNSNDKDEKLQEFNGFKTDSLHQKSQEADDQEQNILSSSEGQRETQEDEDSEQTNGLDNSQNGISQNGEQADIQDSSSGSGEGQGKAQEATDSEQINDLDNSQNGISQSGEQADIQDSSSGSSEEQGEAQEDEDSEQTNGLDNSQNGISQNGEQRDIQDSSLSSSEGQSEQQEDEDVEQINGLDNSQNDVSKSGEQRDNQEMSSLNLSSQIDSQEIINDKDNHEKTPEDLELKNKKESLYNLRDILSKIYEKKEEEEKLEQIKRNSEFFDGLKDLPSFKDRKRGDGYSKFENFSGDVPDDFVRIIINKFLKQRFLKKDSTLNTRSVGLEKTLGYYKWNYVKLVKHLETEQYTKIPLDKYDYKPEAGGTESIPFSFYFDLSGSMAKFTGLLSVIAIELLKSDVKVLIGFNEVVNVQIDSIKKSVDIKELEKLLKKFSNNQSYKGDKLNKNDGVSYRIINQNIDDYLINKKAEKCVIYADFDPFDEICNLSLNTEVYWFCFENEFTKVDLDGKYNGFLYKVKNLDDIMKGLLVINESKFQNLCYIDDENILNKKL